MSDWLDIHALADGQLDGEERRRAEERCASDASSAAELRSVQTLKDTLRYKAEPQTCAKTWSRCRDRLAEMDRARRVESFVGKYAWGLTSLFLVAILGAALFNQSAGPRELRTGDVAKLVSGVAQIAPTREAMPEDMKAWIRNAPLRLEMNGFQVQMLDQGVWQGRHIARFRLVDRAGALALLVVRGVDSIDGVAPLAGRSGYFAGTMDSMSCVNWLDQGVSLSLVGPRSFEELAIVADSIRLSR